MRFPGFTGFPYARFGFTLLLGTAGGGLFFVLGLPLPFMLGSMIACAVAAILGLPVAAPMQVRPPMSAIIGTMIGASVTPSLLGFLPSMLGSMMAMVGFLIVCGVVNVAYLCRVAGMDLRTAYFAGMPGGLIEMVTQAEENGADGRRVAIVHSLRIILIVFSVPFLVLTVTGAARVTGFDTAATLADVDAGFVFWFLLSSLLGIAAGNLFRLPAKYFIGPMIVSALVHLMGWTDYKLPFEMVIAAQIVLGATIGCRFAGVPAREIAGVALAAVGSTAILLGTTAIFAVAVTQFLEFDFLTILLSYSPGGLAEISLLALALQIETAVVAAHHVARVLLVGFGAPLVFLILRRRQDRRR